MTDRELLEAAAKAAGLTIVYWAQDDYPVVRDGDNNVGWSPLKFDSDALRLAVKLRFAVNVWHGCSVMTGSGLAATCVMEDISDDPYAATRRAIVRAAAAMGEKA